MASLGMTEYLMDALLNHAFRGIAYTPPTSLTVHMFTTNPTLRNGSDAVEVAADEYAPQTIAYDAPITDGTARKIASNLQIIWPTADESWGTIVGFGIKDQLGNLLYAYDITEAKAIGIGDPPKSNVGAHTIKFTS